jgi:hypothetical protein
MENGDKKDQQRPYKGFQQLIVKEQGRTTPVCLVPTPERKYDHQPQRLRRDKYECKNDDPPHL